MPQTIIFDFDGTIADSLETIASLFNEVAPKYNLPLITDHNKEELRGMGAKEIIKKLNISKIKLLRVTLDVQAKFRNQSKFVKSFPGIPDLITDLHNKSFRIGIISSNTDQNIRLFLKSNNINEIDFIHSEKNLFGKDKVLTHTINEEKLNKENVWYVGDEVRDIEASRKAGIKIISVTWGFNTKQRLLAAKPDFIVSNPKEILSIIKE